MFNERNFFMKQRRVVVTGIGTLNPLGNNIEEYFTNLTQGVSGAGPITHFDPSNFKTKFACELKGYDPNNFFDRKEVRKYDLYTQYALIAAEQAIKDSGLDLETIDKDMAGVIWASGIGGLETFYQEVKSYVEGGEIPRYSPFFIPKMIADMGAGQISMKYGFRGPNYCTVSACASSNNAMIDAMTYIRLGRADIIMTGGSEAAINPPGVGGFNSMQALSTRNDDPTHASRPFDADRDGFVIGEGAGALILEEYEHAKARGAKIYAEVAGGGMSADAYHLTAPHPEGLGARKSMSDAINDAGLKPEDIDLVNTHGTSTPVGDVAELNGIKATFGDHVYKMDYADMLREHLEHNAACTISVLQVSMDEATRFGIMNLGPDGYVEQFEEKPKQPKSDLASMGIYIFNWKKLRKYLIEDENDPTSSKDFGKNIIPNMLKAGEKLWPYRFDGYWRDVGTITSLWDANMDMLSTTLINLYDPSWPIRSRSVAQPPHYVGPEATVVHSIVTEGCEIEGHVENSVLSSSAVVEKGAKVLYSVLMPGAKVEEGAVVEYAIIGEQTVIHRGAHVGAPPDGSEAWGVATCGPRLDIRENASVKAGAMIYKSEEV